MACRLERLKVSMIGSGRNMAALASDRKPSLFHRLYALSEVLPDLRRPRKSTLAQAMQGKVVAEAVLVGRFAATFTAIASHSSDMTVRACP